MNFKSSYKLYNKILDIRYQIGHLIYVINILESGKNAFNNICLSSNT